MSETEITTDTPRTPPARYPKGHPNAGRFMPTGRVDVRRLRSILRSALASTDPEVQAVLDEFRAINPDATKRRRRDDEPRPIESLPFGDSEQVSAFGNTFFLRSETIFPDDDFEMILFQADSPVTDAEIDHALQIIGYAWKQNLAGEALTRAERLNETTFGVWAPARSSQRTFIRNGVRDFEIDLPIYFEEGSPIRTSNRRDRKTGESVKGTRLVDGMGRKIAFRLYYDSVTSEPFEAIEE